MNINDIKDAAIDCFDLGPEHEDDILRFMCKLEDMADPWISVKDRLPEHDVSVLVKLRHPNKENWPMMVANCFSWPSAEPGHHLHGRRVWYGASRAMSNGEHDVTHWMPLPTPPRP